MEIVFHANINNTLLFKIETKSSLTRWVGQHIGGTTERRQKNYSSKYKVMTKVVCVHQFNPLIISSFHQNQMTLNIEVNIQNFVY